jgi:uncharacterized protein (DUF849 family)
MSQHLPLTPQQIADEAVSAAEAGAGTVHLHAREPEAGKPTSDLSLFREICTDIHQRSEVVMCTTTGGALGMTPEERVAVVSELEPELASMNMGSMNFGIFPLADKFDEYRFDWEKSYLAMTRDYIFPNTFASMEIFLKTMRDHGTRPELECYDLGHLYSAAFMAEQGLLQKPYYFQFILGILGGIGPSIENLVHMKNTADHLFGQDYVWSVLPVGRFQFSYGTVAAVMGGNVRVGMEDNLYLSKGRLLTSNAEAVSKIRGLMEELSIEIADPEETRQILKLKGKDQVNI